jgi:predicted short-subunit dehydrogenase-like oxidoreductase (DUF2520 family)
MHIALVGAGRVGTAVTELLRSRGHRIVGVWSRTETSATRASQLTGAPVITELDDLAGADTVLIGTSENAIEQVAASLAGSSGPLEGVNVVHFAGAYGLGPLSSLKAHGAVTHALHPVQACPSIEAGIARLPGCCWGITSDAEEWARRFVSEAGGHAVVVSEGDRTLWHAAAVSTSNGIAALMSVGGAMLESLGFENPQEVLGPLAAGTVANAVETPGGASITGPIVRAEVAVVERHLVELARRVPELLPAYLLGARSVLEAAVRTGRIDPAPAGQVHALLSSHEDA